MEIVLYYIGASILAIGFYVLGAIMSRNREDDLKRENLYLQTKIVGTQDREDQILKIINEAIESTGNFHCLDTLNEMKRKIEVLG